MRWRQMFMTEVMESLQRLGLTGCPVCGSPESLGVAPCPVLLVDGGIPSDPDSLTPSAEGDADLTFAVRIECTTCGHLMLFNAQRYRTADEKILIPGRAEDENRAAE
jgi:hypothetical protein